MQREIEFRGQRVDTKECVHGYLFGIWEQRYILWGTTNGIPNMIEVIPETVGQYTGFKDKNGKIYEGDIVRLTERTYENCRKKKLISEEVKVMIVSYDYGAFGLKKSVESSKFKAFLWLSEADELEVIGNVYESPELLTQSSINT